MNPKACILLFSLLSVPALTFADCGSDCGDRDNDGVVDQIDQCPDSERGAPVTIQGCAHDTDGDGVPEYRDNCPAIGAESVDEWGCPVATEIDLPGIKFEVNSARILRSSHEILDDTAAILRRYDGLEAEIAGHTDNSGSAAHNRSLSRLRANAVRRYLIEAGIEPGRITARGYGESRPITENESEQGRSRNRRVVLRILGGQLKDAES